MNKKPVHSPFVLFFSALALLMLTFSESARAQSLPERMTQANQAWKDQRYDKCQAIFLRIVENFGGRAKMLYGPRFGVIWYRKGLSELKLANIAKRANNVDEATKWFEEAAKSFEVCYKEFPNGAAGMAQSLNGMHKASLQRWAEASMGKKEYKEAIKLYKKFLAEREQRDKILPSPGGFYINLAICNFLMEEKPNIPEGIRHFETALKDKEKLRTSDAAVVAAFLAMSQAVIKQKNEAAMVDFLNKNRADISLPPYQLYEYTPVFMKLAANALESEMYKAGFNLYAMIPDTEEVIADLQVRLDQLSDRKGIKDGMTIIEASRLQSGLTKMRAKMRSGDPDDVKVLKAMAYLQDLADNQRGVFGVMEQLELFYNKSKDREEHLFSLVRVSSIIGEILTTEHYGSIFLKDFPESDKVDTVRRLMLSSLFFGGEYKKSLEVAEVMIDKLPKPSEQHDICLFVLGGSHFYLGNFEKAEPFLDQHVKEYPKSKFVMHAEYFQASNLTRLQYWDKAAGLLDKFLEKYPKPSTNIYTPNALYDRANCHFAESQYDPALVLLNRLEEEFNTSAIIDMAYNMKGNIFESRGEFEDAEKYYILALNTAERGENDIVAGEALSYLIGMLGMETIGDKKTPNPRIKDAIPYYDKFMDKYFESPYKPQVVVYGLPPMRAVGREDEALENVQAVIIELSGKKKQFFLEEVINAYSTAFLAKKGNTPEMLKNLYYNFPEIDLANKRTLALLRIAIIGVFEDELQKAEKEKNEPLILSRQAAIKALFRDLKSEFQPSELTNFVLIRVGDYLREKTSAPKQALPYYEELMKRKNKEGLEFKAMLGIADVKGRSSSVADNKAAVKTLGEVVNRAKDDPTTQGKALFRMIEISTNIGDWASVETHARKYLDEKFTKKAAEVSYMYAQSFDKRNKINDALFYYGMVYSRYRGYIKISAPATKRVMEILWDRNLPEGSVVNDKKIDLSDRQTAYQAIGYPYVKSTRKIRDTQKKMTDQEKEDWDAVASLVNQYETSGQIKNMKQVEEDRKKRR